MFSQVRCSSIWLYVYVRSAVVFPAQLDEAEDQEDPAIAFGLGASEFIAVNNHLLKEITGVPAFSTW